MTTEKKIETLSKLDDISVLTNEHFSYLCERSSDEDSTVRSMVASLLVNFVNDTSKSILLRLAEDEDSLVRTEAYDSLSVFSCIEVEYFLEKKIISEKNNLARSYTILSWTDVFLSIHSDILNKIDVLESGKIKKRMQVVGCVFAMLYICLAKRDSCMISLHF